MILVCVADLSKADRFVADLPQSQRGDLPKFFALSQSHLFLFPTALTEVGVEE